MKSKTEIVKPLESVKVNAKNQLNIIVPINANINIQIKNAKIDRSFIFNIPECDEIEVKNNDNQNEVYVLFFTPEV
jgi:hypothetical protein